MRSVSDNSDTAKTLEVSPAAKTAGEELAAGPKLGRYSVLGTLGTGGMGRVYHAYDPKLGREIAIKAVLLKSSRRPLDSDAESRLVREAQAMAQLSHPNVLPVFDVECIDGEMVIAMEYVDGETLRAWMKRGPHGWRKTVEVFVAAGRGLLAAHQAGLVHRDFKPDNVMLGKDGRIRVMDFGIARGMLGEDSSLHPSDGAGTLSVDSPSIERNLTAHGTILGTPGYMAPEQHEGAAADDRSDQFAFCVALFQALHGRRPYPGRDEHILRKQKAAGPPPTPTRAPGPSRIHRAVTRGLAVDPNHRWPSMEALLEELCPPSTGSRRAMWIGGGAITVALGAWALSQTDDRAPCPAPEADVRAVWSPQRRAAIEAQLSGTGLPYATATWERIAPQLDAYASAWVDARVEACRDTRVRQVQPEVVLDQRTTCLKRRLSELDALAGVLEDADADVVEGAVASVQALHPIDRCSDVEYLGTRVAPPSDPKVAAAVERLREALVRAKALGDAGQYQRALKLARDIVSESRELGYEPLVARALSLLGDSEADIGDYTAALASLQESYFTALRAGDDALAARSAMMLMKVYGHDLRDSVQALEWTEHARAIAGRHPEDAGVQHMLAQASGIVFAQAGRHREALAQLQRAADAQARLGIEDGWAAVETHNAMGVVFRKMGDFEAARGHYERALAILTTEAGPDHPMVGMTRSNLSIVLRHLGRTDEAIEEARFALRIAERAHPDGHPSLAMPLSSLSNALEDAGNVDEALEMSKRALSVARNVHGDTHPNVAGAMNNIGNALERAGRLDEALKYYAQARDGFEAALGREHVTVALGAHNVGALLLRKGEPEAAIPELERALKIREAVDGNDRYLAGTQAALADALWKTGRDRARGVELYRLARKTFAAQGEAAKDELAKADAWLEQHADDG